MNTKGNKLLYVYIFVLLLSIIYRIICITTGNEDISIWSRIVVAATISTCFFCISDFFAAKNDMLKYKNLQIDLLSEKQANSTQRILAMIEKELERDDAYNTEHRKQKEERLIHEVNKALKIDKPTDIELKESIGEFWFDIIGFFIFFGILIFGDVFQCLYPYQDIITVLSFVIVFCTVLFKEKELNKINNDLQNKLGIHDRLEVARSVIEVMEYKKDKKEQN